MENKQYLDETGLSEVGKIISKFYASKDDLNKIDVTEQLTDYMKKTEVPTKLSQLANDKSFKTEDEIKQLINDTKKLKKEVVTSLPTTGVDDVVYLLKNKSDSNNACTEYLWIDGKWEIIGDTKVDLSGYVEKVQGKGLSTHDFTDERLETVEKMAFEQKRLKVIEKLVSHGDVSHKTAIVSGDYGLIAINDWVDLADYSNIEVVGHSANLLEKIKTRVIETPTRMQVTVKKIERIGQDGSKTYAITQTLYDPATRITFSNRTKTFKKEYSDEVILKNLNIDKVWNLEYVVPQDDWGLWTLDSDYNYSLIPVQPGKLLEGFSCGLMTPDDKEKLDSIDIEAIKSVINNSNNNNIPWKLCNFYEDIYSKGKDAPNGKYIDASDKNTLRLLIVGNNHRNRSLKTINALDLTVFYGLQFLTYVWNDSESRFDESGFQSEKLLEDIAKIKEDIARLKS